MVFCVGVCDCVVCWWCVFGVWCCGVGCVDVCVDVLLWCGVVCLCVV